jgi:hypothetical protein
MHIFTETTTITKILLIISNYHEMHYIIYKFQVQEILPTQLFLQAHHTTC